MKARFGWNDGFNRNLILSKLDACRSISSGRCAFNAAEYAFWRPVLKSAVRAPAAADHLKARCIGIALNDASLKLGNPDAFIARCNRAYEQISGGPKSKYVMFCSITYTGPMLIEELSDGKSKLRWQPAESNRVYARAKRSRHSIGKLLRSHGVPEAPPGLTDILVHVDAFDVVDALDQATNLIDRFRGILNLIVNSTRGVNPFFRLSKPHAVNKFRLGPYRTIHKPTGELAIEQFWYEPRWSHDQATAKFSGDTDKTSAKLTEWWLKSRKNPLREHIADGLLRYCRALDLHDTDATLLGLWGALEALTGTQREKYEVTISRAVALAREHDLARQIARHVMLRRNANVHAAVSPESDEVEAVILHAEWLVSQALFFCIRKGSMFRGSDELIKFLDFSLDLGGLARQRRLMAEFMNFQRR